ncbi:MAG: Phosphoribosyl-AMP cyclohydrolase [ANME-2 cluster archaeon HR1]|jgi:phosphoribosyl-AMP cyclohydrolase|nr:MAG: phosphoribosyl-AMP cyclohydrolase [ANME-2 cluster archaeon]PPA78979.1 MAG: Phosphoribosyl-AMP cyclohydrolase [ANME-2 cluster archaeon HR1]
MKISDEILKELKFDDKGLLTAVAQDFETNEILMVAFMNLEALLKTIETEKAHYYSRSRAKQWLKGESSGHIQIVHEMYIDCDADAVVMKVEQVAGGACHTGYRSCFYRTVDGNIVGEKVFNPEEVY